ncbi:MAG: hypothetical protein M3N24_05715 [Actinomycetota bacterium]|nr:hypothetical protein [Actinomycetota bacterium]
MTSNRKSTLIRSVLIGAIVGAGGGVAMAMFAMIAGATYQGTGFFTPMYHIAVPLIGGEPMMTSASKAAAGSQFHLEVGPAMLGFAAHMMTAVAFGAVFGLLVHVVRPRGVSALALGAIFGVAVMVFMSFAGLPVVASVLGGGDAVRNMPKMVGWATFTGEHILYGIVLGAGALIARETSKDLVTRDASPPVAVAPDPEPRRVGM